MTSLKLKLAMDEEVAEDFRESFSDHYDTISHCVMELEKEPNNRDFLDEIFRSLHTIKGNANMCQFEELTQLTHALENVVTSLREEKISFTKIVGEIILLTLDKAKEVSEDMFNDIEIDYDVLAKIEIILNTIENAAQDKIHAHAKELVSLISAHVIDADILVEESNSSPQLGIPNESAPTKTSTKPRIKPETPVELSESLTYFSHLASLLESKLPYWKGRIQRTLPLAQAINEALGSPVDVYQLEAAVYMHDVSFAFLSETLVLADSKYNYDEIQQIRSHPRLAAGYTRLIPGLEVATEIIYQHHERWDGKGYPKGLQAEEICIGAQILAIVDAYESMTHPRPDRQYKRSILRAVTEINNCSGTQFSPDITSVFNEIVRKVIASQKQAPHGSD